MVKRRKSGMFGKNFTISIANEAGEFVPIVPINQPRRIVCEAVPGRDGIEYVTDWYGITHHG